MQQARRGHLNLTNDFKERKEAQIKRPRRMCLLTSSVCRMEDEKFIVFFDHNIIYGAKELSHWGKIRVAVKMNYSLKTNFGDFLIQE